ncbi:hypothetical protein OSTOST_15722 [Ostertagia ostertagi]
MSSLFSFDFSESDTEVTAIGQNEQVSDMFPASRSRKNKERRAERKMRRFLDLENGVVNSKNAGARKQRQSENVRLLMSFVDKEDICTDFSDIVPQTVTAFDRLFIDQENMQVWNDFIERDEEEQRQILNGKESSSGCGWFIVGGNVQSPSRALQGVDGRKHHPAYCGRACFERMDIKSRRLLSEKRLPWAFIDRLEGELLSFFCSSSPGAGASDDAVYVGVFGNSLERALGHAIAQFLMLKSKSVTDRGSGERLTEFRNPRAIFIPPHTRLIPFLSSLRSEPIDLPPSFMGGEGADEEGESPDSSFSEVYPDHSES